MKLFEILLEYGSSNPFIGIVSAIDLRIQEVNVAVEGKSNKIFISSIKSQLNDLMKFLKSGDNWIIPDPKLRKELHEALPLIKHEVSLALDSAISGDINKVKSCLITARKITIKRSHLKFGTIE
jgi:hypothetical protein